MDKPPKKPSMHRRSHGHDYSAPGTYLITITVRDRRPLLGTLLSSPTPYIEYTELGKAINKEELPKMHEVYPMVQVKKACIMPDHIHIIINVKSELPPKTHLGHVIGGFKTGCNKAYRSIAGELNGSGLFNPRYNDRILYNKDTLETWLRYLADNPRRLAVKRANPDLFTVTRGVDLLGMTCGMVGNRFLLDVPDKEAVIVHRSDSDADFSANFSRWMEIGEAGGVLVSAAIAQREKDVMREAFARGYNIIQLCENGFDRYYKPTGRTFNACAAGTLLQISPWEHHTDNRAISRRQCMQLNDMARAIASMK